MKPQEIIAEIEQLLPEDRDVIVQYLISNDIQKEMIEKKPLSIEEDSDIGLEEDIAELDRNLNAYDTKDCISHQDFLKKYGLS